MPRVRRLALLTVALVAFMVMIWWLAPPNIRLLGAAVAVVLILAGACALLLPTWLVAQDATLDGLSPEQRASAVNSARTTLVQGLLGFVALGGILVAMQQLQTDREQFRTDRQQLREQLDLTRQGQVEGRFTSAIDQLGSDKVEQRLGGIYGLERIAEEFSSTRLQVFEVLTAYIRQHARLNPKVKEPNPNLAELKARAPDVQAAVTVIGRRTVLETDPRIDLRNVDLRKADLAGAHLEGVDLSGSQLHDAVLIDANLQMAKLDDAQLYFARLDHAQLQEASFQRAQMSGADLKDANLQAASLAAADLRTAIFFGAYLWDADLTAATLRGATQDGGTVWPKGFNWRGRGVTYP